MIILGNGMGGAYLARLMALKGEEVVVYGRRHTTACGCRPCAWGFGPGVWDLIRGAGLDPDDYVLCRDRMALLEGVKVPCDLVTMDKPRLIGDLLQGVEVVYQLAPVSGKDIVDARGIHASGGLRAECVQMRVHIGRVLPEFHSIPGLGYRWAIPLGNGEAHMGMGRVRGDVGTLWRDLRAWVENSEVACACSGPVTLSGPALHQGEGWALGEAAGLVNPLTGEGNTYAMLSARLLLDSWPDLTWYSARLGWHFRWMEGAARVVRKLHGGSRLGLADYPVLLRAFRRSGFYPRGRSLPRLFLRLRRGLRP